MVLIYADGAAAQTARVHAQTQKPNDSASTNPYLIAGDGTSVWKGNVALVQSPGSELNRLFDLLNDCNNDLYDDPNLVRDASRGVDPDFQQVLLHANANL